MCVVEYKRDGNEIVITCKKSDYAHYLYDERIGLPQRYACNNLVAGCLLETSDNYYIVGELEENTSLYDGVIIHVYNLKAYEEHYY